MKKCRLLTTMLALIASSLFFSLSAQQNLLSWVKKCENESSINMTVIFKKDPKTKKEESKTISIEFKDKPSLLKDLLKAYNNDKDKAYKMSEKVVNGQQRPDYCQFWEKDELTKCYFRIYDNGRVYVYIKKTFNVKNPESYSLNKFEFKSNGKLNDLSDFSSYEFNDIHFDFD